MRAVTAYIFIEHYINVDGSVITTSYRTLLHLTIDVKIDVIFLLKTNRREVCFKSIGRARGELLREFITVII